MATTTKQYWIGSVLYFERMEGGHAVRIVTVESKVHGQKLEMGTPVKVTLIRGRARKTGKRANFVVGDPKLDTAVNDMLNGI